MIQALVLASRHESYTLLTPEGNVEIYIGLIYPLFFFFSQIILYLVHDYLETSFIFLVNSQRCLCNISQ
ncbi:hypothetical protein BDE02_03G075700 [Populus trichocarpa]|nr:hypothetical protein BDE02_03G075700 [Populus trichocarpa]